MLKLRNISNLIIVLIIIVSFMGCSNPSGASDNSEIQPTVKIAETINFDQENIIDVPVVESDSEGAVLVSKDTYTTLEMDVKYEIANEAGESIQGLEFYQYIVDGSLVTVIHDPAGLYADTFIQVDTNDYDVASNGRFVLTIATGILIVKVVAVTVSVVTTAIAATNLIHEMHDFHVDNFQNISWKTISYRTNIGELLSLILSAGDFALSVLSLTAAIGSMGTTTIISTGQALKLLTKEMGKLALEVWKSVIINYVAETLDAANVAYDKIDAHTELIVNINFLPDGVLNGFDSGIEIIPVLDSRVEGLSPEMLLGSVWTGNTHIKNNTTKCKIMITEKIDNNTVVCVFYDYWDDESNPDIYRFNIDLDGFDFSGNYDTDAYTFYNNSTQYTGYERIDFAGTVTGNSLLLNYTVDYQYPSSLPDPDDIYGTVTAARLP